jgi:hypothetical protein
MLVTALSTQLLVSSVVREEQLKQLDMLVTALSTQLLVSSVVREEQLLETVGHVSHSTQHPTARVQCSKGGAIKTVGTC